MNRTVGLLVVLVCTSPLGFAQATVDGSVRTEGAAAVAGASIVLQYADGRMAAQTSTDGRGEFHLPNLTSGHYRLIVEASGYFPSTYDFTLRPREPLTVTLTLTARSEVKQSVEVRGNYETIHAQKTGSSQTFTAEQLDELPDPMIESTTSLVANLMPGATESHDNFIAVRGTEFSLHEFINGVSFLDNTQPQFSPGVSPQIFETVDLITGGFNAEYGNRFGGVLDIVTRSGRTLNGHGDVDFRGATFDNYDLNADYGGSVGRWGYYVFGDGFTSGRYLDPPSPIELYDFGSGARGTAQMDWQGAKDTFKLLLLGGGTYFQQPNLPADQVVGRNARRQLRQQTAIATWTHVFSAKTLVSSSVYQRIDGDHILPTDDPITPFSVGSRSTLTLGTKTDLVQTRGGHIIKAGVDLARFRELESFVFDPRGDPDPAINFRGGITGGQASAYVQDHFSLLRNLTVDAGLRYDYFDLIDTGVQVSPRVGLAYHIARTGSVIHAAYNRFFSPPPLEYSLLASFIGHTTPEIAQRVGDVRPYTQNYFEVGWEQELADRISLEINAYTHSGHNAFENHEISITRLFLPINFSAARSSGAEMVLNLDRLESKGITARFEYALAKTFFYGPITGGFAGNEPLVAGERIIPAFDQTHTGTAYLFYHRRWRGWWAGTAMRYGSGTIIEAGPRLPQHFTADLASGLTVWKSEPRSAELEFDVTNVGDNRYAIAKESEEIPIQYAPARTLGGSVKFHF